MTAEPAHLAHVAHLRRLLTVGRALIDERDPAAMLDRILAESRAATGARYAAIGVLDGERTRLERLITAGLGPHVEQGITELPLGRGVLGVVIRDPRPLRLADVHDHPERYGFPAGHPAMHSFLGVPLLIRGEAWGNLYLTEKAGGGAFTEDDEEAATILAQWAATAIENARLFDEAARRGDELEQAVRSLEAARDIAEAISGVADLDRVLELIATRGRALVQARTVLIMLRDGEELIVTASAGYGDAARGRRLPMAGSSSGQVLRQGEARRVDDAAHDLRIAPARFGMPDARRGLIVPLMHRRAGLGVLVAFDRGEDQAPFTEEDERLLVSFAASAASAVAHHRSVEADRLRSQIAAAEAERARWARELHDQTLQSLGALRVELAGLRSRSDRAAGAGTLERATADLDAEIANLRTIIADLRPAILDDLGLAAALEALIDRRRAEGLPVTGPFARPADRRALARLDLDLQTIVYRLVQEALTNVVRHARASAARVTTAVEGETVTIEVVDDGVGFDAKASFTGFGLVGMRERAVLRGGRLEVSSGAGDGTRIRAVLPRAAVAQDVISPRSNA